jgi:hypothetical protein
MMERVLVVAVGAEEYDSRHTAPPLPTAGPDAIRIAARLQAMGAAPQNTFVFLAPTRRTPRDQSDFETLRRTLKPGTTIEYSCTYQTINRFWRERLRDLAVQPNQRLFLYWCGHGFTEVVNGLPSLLCSDWTEALNTNVLNRIDFLETLHSRDFRHLASQLILFDACANHHASGAIAGRTITTWDETIDQVCISSAARGEYATADETSSYFARIILELLSALENWPDLDEFSRNLEQAIRSSGKASAPVFYRRGRGDDLVWRAPNTGRDTLVRRLMNLRIAPSQLRPLYLSVISALAPDSGRGTAQTIPQMVDDLWNGSGRATAAVAPYPAVEFALRVRRVFENDAADLDAWINDDTVVAPSDRKEAHLRLADELKAIYLVIEIVESRSLPRPGEIERFDARLLGYDHARAVEPWTPVKQDVTSWDDLEEKVRPLLNRAREIAESNDASLTIEFVTDVFDIDPHRITLARGEPDTIGEKNPVVLRLRKQRPSDTRQPWIDRADAIRRGAIARHLHPVTTANATLEPCCVLFVGHALPRGSRPPHPQPLTPEWRLVRRSMDAGVPFICWPLRPSATGDWAEYERELVSWVKESRPIGLMPSRVRHERVAGLLAADVNVFWDDPLPTYQLRELRTR